MSFRIENGQIIPILNNKVKNSDISNTNEFEQVLQQSIKNEVPVKISSHALLRMNERNIELKESDISVINQAMNDLEKKGARESLMIYKDMTFIASVNNRTIITALKESETNIVTNIDSAVLIK
ncbi:MAG: TIGR02530 family flagellar biosynthesis protein [Eubacteriaceae bacterium]